MAADRPTLLLDRRPLLSNTVRASTYLGSVFRGSGAGSFAGAFPDGVTSLEGVPTSAEVLVRVRAPGSPFDGVVVARTVSAPSGEWLVEGMPDDGVFDVVARKEGECDVVKSDVRPLVPLKLVAPDVFYTPVGAARSFKFVAEGGEPPYTYAVVSGTLPTGVTLVDDTLVAASPTATPGVYPITVEVADVRSDAVQHAMAVELVSLRFWFYSSFPFGATLFVGEAESFPATVVNAVGSVTFSISSGALPTGMSLNTGTGEISGTPTVVGESYSFSITATDSHGPTSETQGPFSGKILGQHAYWRVNVTASNSHCSAWEIEMAAAIGGPDQCTGGTAIASSNHASSGGAATAFDGVLADPGWYSGSGTSGWIGYQFASPVRVAEVRIAARMSYSQSFRDFTIQYSDDGSSWFTAATYTNQTSWPYAAFLSFPV